MRVGEGRKKSSGHRQVSCLARVGQAASVQAWENIGSHLGGPAASPACPLLPFQEASQNGAYNSPPSRGGSGMWKLAQRAWLPTLPQSRNTQHQNASCGEEGSTLGPNQAGKPGVGWGWRLGYSAGLIHRGGVPLSSSPAQGHGLWAWPHSLLDSALRAPQGGWEPRPLSSQCCVYKK